MIELSSFLIPNSAGRHINLLNDNNHDFQPPDSRSDMMKANSQKIISEDGKRRYACTAPGCNKVFTTSGHLSRHNRIHTGEKNFPCLFPGCQSRFSRQDNMMQHYKTHMSIRTKRRKSPVVTDITYLKPKLYAHHEIDSNSLDRPLTIDQHLHVYRLNKQSQNHPLKYNMPEPLSSVAAERVSRRMSIKPDEQPSTGSHQQKENLSRLAFYEHTTLSYHKGLSKLPYPFTLPHPDKKQDVQQQKDHYVSPVLSKRVRNESSPKEHHSEQTQVIPSTFSGSHLAYITSTLD